MAYWAGVLLCIYSGVHQLNTRFPTDEVKLRTSEAKKMLTTWQDVYKDVRQKIEASGRDQRWEFDRKRLFERTDYMANICQNLYDIAQVKETKFDRK